MSGRLKRASLEPPIAGEVDVGNRIGGQNHFSVRPVFFSIKPLSSVFPALRRAATDRDHQVSVPDQLHTHGDGD